MANDTWYHVAGVLSNEDHSGADTDDHSTVDCADGNGNSTGGNAETPHLDIYIDGAIVACATTWGDAADPTPTAPQGVLDPDRYAVADNTVNTAEIGYLKNTLLPLLDSVDGGNFEGVLDEVRVWTSARTASQVVACKDVELSIGHANCNSDDSSLIGYWRFNIGSGHGVSDSSGNGLSRAMEVGVDHWSDGWVTGKF